MITLTQVARACLAVGAILSPSSALAGDLCPPDWHAQVEKTAELGLQLLHSGRAADRVRLWRLIELGEEVPSGNADQDFPSRWHGSWQDEQDAYRFLAEEAAKRGVTWSLTSPSYGSSRLNVWYAAKLFEERRELLGDQHPYLKQWLQNQLAVFAKTSPDLVDASREYEGIAGELAADDFHYQVAAALFYAASYTSAVDSFRAIAARADSRYRTIAAYMAARSLVHAGRNDEALTEIASIVSNPELSEVHSITQELLGVLLWDDGWYAKSTPATQEAARRLLFSNARAMRLPLAILESDSSRRAEYWEAVNDLAYFLRSDGSRSWMRGKFDEDWWLGGTHAENAGTWGAAVASVAGEDDLIDWLQSTEQVRVLAAGPWLDYWSIRTNSSAFRMASEHVRQRAEESGKLTWLVADAMRSPSTGNGSSAMHHIISKLEDCTASRAELLALGGLRYHVARAEADSDTFSYRHLLGAEIDQISKLDSQARREATRRILPFIGALSNIPLPLTDDADLNRLLSKSLDEFMAVRAGYEGGDGQIAVLNMLPNRVLLKLAGDETLAAEFRAPLIRAVWTKAYLLGDETVLDPATVLLAKLNPGLSEMAESYRGAWTQAGRKRAALRLLVRAPSMQVFIPSSSDVAYSYQRRGHSAAKAGKWSWYLSPAETAEEAIGLFWADDWNHNDGNWWCRPDIVRLQTKLERDFYDVPLALAYRETWYSYYDPQAHIAFSLSLRQELENRRRDFLGTHPVLKLVDWEELGRLSKIPAAPEYLADELMTWVKEAGWLERWLHGDEMAEALALAVRATRFGCHRDGSNRRQSYAAFRMLHELFPDSAAAQHARYWYD